jgi:hypothetical protein
MTMTTTNRPLSNGNAQRKSLSSQLDRLDSILDGLDGALSGAITDAVKDAVSTAVAETVRATLIEIVSNPQVISLLRGVVPSIVQPTGQQEAQAPRASEPTPHGPTRRGVTSAWRWATAKLRATRQATVLSARQAVHGLVRTWRRANAVWQLKRPLFVALLIGFVAGMVSYASSPWVAGIVSGVSTTGAVLGMQLALFARRLFAGFRHAEA